MNLKNIRLNEISQTQGTQYRFMRQANAETQKVKQQSPGAGEDRGWGVTIQQTQSFYWDNDSFEDR